MGVILEKNFDILCFQNSKRAKDDREEIRTGKKVKRRTSGSNSRKCFKKQSF